jgi:hypothetical protein
MAMEKLSKKNRQGIVKRIVDSNDKAANIVLQICDDARLDEYGSIVFILNGDEFTWNEGESFRSFPVKEFADFTWMIIQKNQEIQSLLSDYFHTSKKLEQLTKES